MRAFSPHCLDWASTGQRVACVAPAYLFLYLKNIFYVFILFLRVNIKNNFLKNKKYIILMHFQTKKTLKNNLYYTSKYTQQSDKKNPLEGRW
jgi:hypothetical protein